MHKALRHHEAHRHVLAALLCCTVFGCDSAHPTSKSSNRIEPAAPIASTDGVSASENRDARPADEALVRPAAESREVASAQLPQNDRLQVAPDSYARFGIQGYDSEHLRLFTDISPEVARQLPPLADQAYEAFESFFGSIRDAEGLKAVGYLMGEPRRFREAGLLPANLPEVRHGEQLGTEFWIREQATDYYRRHLMLHELVHWFMRARGQVDGPLWYLEGMAEFLATHKIGSDGKVSFGVMPDGAQGFENFGRIEMIQDDVRAGRLRTLSDVMAIATRDDFQQTEAYAWSWALCHFLGKHPSYRDRLRQLAGTALEGFSTAFEDAFKADRDLLQAEWPLFVTGLQYGYDLQRAAIDFQLGRPLVRAGALGQCDIAADRGWQSSGVLLEAGREYKITASGRFTLAQEPRPWVSESQGISFRYFSGRPLGMLIATIHNPVPSTPAQAQSMLEEVAVGQSQRVAPTTGGTLYLRLNDSWSELADNTGSVRVEVREVIPGEPSVPTQ